MEQKTICRVNREPEGSFLFAFGTAPETYPEFSNPVVQPILLELHGAGSHHASASALVTESPLPRSLRIALLLIHINVEPVLNLVVKSQFQDFTRLADSKTFKLNNSQLVYRIWSRIYWSILLLSGIDPYGFGPIC